MLWEEAMAGEGSAAKTSAIPCTHCVPNKSFGGEGKTIHGVGRKQQQVQHDAVCGQHVGAECRALGGEKSETEQQACCSNKQVAIAAQQIAISGQIPQCPVERRIASQRQVPGQGE